jgi:hypothetical protein
MQTLFAQGIELPTITNAAILAAVVGLVGSLTVAVINALAARRLERAKALRAYRERLFEPARSYVLRKSQMIGGFRARFITFEWDVLREPTRQWLVELAQPDESDSTLLVTGWLMTRAFKEAVHAQKLFTNELAMMTFAETPTAEQPVKVDDRIRHLLDAFGLVEKTVEIFIYGGVRARFGALYKLRQIKSRRAVLEKTATPIPKE